MLLILHVELSRWNFSQNQFEVFPSFNFIDLFADKKIKPYCNYISVESRMLALILLL
jgi:hypothetical protein